MSLQAIHSGQLDAETALRQSARPEDLLLPDATDIAERHHLELAYWLVANGIMEVKVAIRGDRIFHNKSGIVEDAQGNRVAFAGSLNETLSGWRHNWESVHVYTDGTTVDHLEATEAEFEALWNNQATGLTVIDLPTFYRDYIIERGTIIAAGDRICPRKRRKNLPAQRLLAGASTTLSPTTPTVLWPPFPRRYGRTRSASANKTWEATSFRRLIADEVGLGKTLQAGVILKTRLNQGKARRALIIAPKAATKQWQSELLMKFAIDAPLIDAHGRYYHGKQPEPAADPPWGRAFGHRRSPVAGAQRRPVHHHLRRV